MKFYMNNAATSYPKPEAVALAAAEATRALPGAANRGGIDSYGVFDAVRDGLRRLMCLDQAGRIALLANATVGLNLALFGFPFEAGDIVVTSLSEHNSVLRPLYALEKRGIIKTVFVPTDKDGRIDEAVWERTFKDNRVRLAVFTHASNVTGAVNDAEKLTKIAKEYGAAVLLDAAQSLGLVEARPQQWGVDLVAFTGHKYLLGPQGTGGLYVREGVELMPHLVGGTGIYSDAEEMPAEMPLRLEAGTGNETSFAGLAAALRWAEENPLDSVALNAMTDRLKQGLQEAGAKVIAPAGLKTPVVSFILDGILSDEVGFALMQGYDIICRSGLHCAPKIYDCIKYQCGGTVRLSLSRFTTEEEVDEVIGAVRQIAEGGIF